MRDPLDHLRQQCQSPADAVRWACILEATAPKAGNVYPGRSFVNLQYADFIIAADIAANCLGDNTIPFSQRILKAVQTTRAQTDTNVNLGILLLLGPLVAADPLRNTDSDWPAAITSVLNQLDCSSSREIFQAIAASSAGGLGTVQQMDVDDADSHDDIVAAMNLASSYDRIALQYASGFDDLLQHVLPTLYDSLCEFSDVLRGIAVAHIRLLAASPDSLIARKQGPDVAKRIQAMAATVDVYDTNACRQFDESLRGDTHQNNPGTTADLIAAALYVLLRTHRSD